MVAELLVQLLAYFVVAWDYLWPLAALVVLSIASIGALRLRSGSRTRALVNWTRVAKKVRKLEKLRRLWANLGHYLNTFKLWRGNRKSKET